LGKVSAGKSATRRATQVAAGEFSAGDGANRKTAVQCSRELTLPEFRRTLEPTRLKWKIFGALDSICPSAFGEIAS
jgi:hypothetical protein